MAALIVEAWHVTVATLAQTYRLLRLTTVAVLGRLGAQVDTTAYKATLWPGDRSGWRRVATGYGAIVLVIAALFLIGPGHNETQQAGTSSTLAQRSSPSDKKSGPTPEEMEAIYRRWGVGSGTSSNVSSETEEKVHNAPSPPLGATTRKTTGLARLGYSPDKCIVCFAGRTLADRADHSDRRGFGLCSKCAHGFGTMQQATSLMKAGVQPSSEMLHDVKQFKHFVLTCFSRDDDDARRFIVMMCMSGGFGTKEWDSLTGGE